MKKSIFSFSMLILLLLSITTIKAQVFYGMTNGGGSSGYGTLFQCTASGIHTTLVNFNGTNGKWPTGKLIQAFDGNLYGMTGYGGTFGYGILFKYNITSGVYTILINFDSSTNGQSPNGSLIQASDSNLYGLTSGSFSPSYGTIFEYSYITNKLSTLVNFNGNNGQWPLGSLIQAFDGSFYGMTSFGGTSNNGLIFKCTPTGSLTTLINFQSPHYGEEPWGNLIQASDSNFYGMTWIGGSYNYGTVFKFSMTGVLNSLINFDGTNGSQPFGSLIQASDGNLYGMTTGIEGTLPQSEGNIFKCTATGVFANLVSFSDTNGSVPEGNLIQATDGNLYGMTYTGGLFDSGTIFKYTIVSGTLTTIYSFNGADGANPTNDLLEVGGVMGVNNINVIYTVSIYPNPSTGIFTFNLQGNTQRTTIEIYNMLGENVYNSHFNSTATQIDLSGRAAGIYLYRILGSDGALIQTGKVEVNH